jgi:hypothetical protein
MYKNKELRRFDEVPGEHFGKSKEGYNRLDPLFRQASEKVKIANFFYDIFQEYKCLYLLYRAAPNNATHSLSKDTINYIVGNNPDNLKEYFPGKEILDDWGNIFNIFGEADFLVFLEKIIPSTDLLEYIEKQDDFIANNNDLLKMITTILKAGCPLPEHFISWLSENLQSISSDDWLKKFTNHTTLLEILDILIDKKYKILLSENYIEGLINYARSVLNNQTPVSIDVHKLMTLLSAKNQTDFKKKLLLAVEDHSNSDHAIPKIFWDGFGEIISNPKLIKSDDKVVHKLFIPIIKKRDRWGIQWLRNLFQKDKNSLPQNTSDNIVNNFKSAIREAEGINDDCTNDIHIIAEILQI